MANRHIARWVAAAAFALTLGACVTAHRPDPEAIADTPTVDAKTLPPEFHRAHIGHDRLRGALPTN